MPSTVTPGDRRRGEKVSDDVTDSSDHEVLVFVSYKDPFEARP